jgi:predicted DNA binding CopG/RHH family protein
MSQYDHTTTIRLSKELLKAARKKALEKGVSLSEIIRELLKQWLEKENDEQA